MQKKQRALSAKVVGHFPVCVSLHVNIAIPRWHYPLCIMQDENRGNKLLEFNFSNLDNKGEW